MLNVIDEFTHECLAIRVARKLKAIDVIDVLSDLFILRGVPGHIRSDNGPEFVAKAVQDGSRRSAPRRPTSRRAARGRTAMSRASTPGCGTNCSTARSSTRLREAQIVIESWRRHYNAVRPHASLGYRPPAPEVFVPAFTAWPAALTRPAPPAMLPLAPRPTLN